jgi:asparagine synthase (glutamine-hydrolysing)
MAAAFYGQRLTDTGDQFYAHRPRWATTARLWNVLSRDMKSRLASVHAEDALRAGLPSGFDRWEALSRDQYVEAQTLLSGYLLSSQGDRVAMANSIEGRFPFLDHTVIEFANALPARLKLRGLSEKAVLKHALAPFLPEGIVRRTKQPYRAPDVESFFVAGRAPDYVMAALDPVRLGRSGLFEPSAVQRLIEKCLAGRAVGFSDNMAFLGVLSTMLLTEFMER